MGLGPAGIGSTFTLLKNNNHYNILCIDAGYLHNLRRCNILSNGDCKHHEPCKIISGFGGCTLLGGGKISCYPAGSGLSKILHSDDILKLKLNESYELIRKYLDLKKFQLCEHNLDVISNYFKKEGFNYKYYEVFNYDEQELLKFYDYMYEFFKRKNINLLLNTTITNISYDNNKFILQGKNNLNSKQVKIITKYLILAVGRLGYKFLININKKLKLGGKKNKIDIGVRLEMPNHLLNKVINYHGDLKLLFNNSRTFCVCKNGKIAPYYLDNFYTTEGHMYINYNTKYTNLSILTRYYQNDIYNLIKNKTININQNKPLSQNYIDYIKNKPTKKLSNTTSIKYLSCGNINDCFPQKMSCEIKDNVNSFVSAFIPEKERPCITVYGPEIEYRGLEFPVQSDFSITNHLYLIGDCVGHFRGFLQAFCSGKICAESILGDLNEN